MAEDGSCRLWLKTGAAGGDFLGSAVSGVGDMNLDSFPDVAVGAQYYDADPDGTPATGDELIAAGRIYVYSGNDGAPIWIKDGASEIGALGSALSGIGDMDVDGYPDLVAAARNHRLDPDGTPNSGDEQAMAGSACLVSGKDGSTVFLVEGENGGDHFGQGLVGAGDVNADGYRDIVVSANGWDAPGAADAGRVYMLSGKDGASLWARDGGSLNDWLGYAVASIADMNGDGIADVLSSAIGYDVDPDGTPFSGDEVYGAGRIYGFSGADGSLFYGENGEYRSNALGQSLSSVGDVNGDGSPDFVAGAPCWDNAADPGYSPGPDGTQGTFDDIGGGHGRVYVISSVTLPLTSDTHLMSVGVASTQALSIDAGEGNALADYWIFSNFTASGQSPGVTMAPGVTIPLNPDVLTGFVISLTQLGGGAPNFVGWKGALDAEGKALASLNTQGPVLVGVGESMTHAALIYLPDGCGLGCDVFELATNWAIMTTVP